MKTSKFFKVGKNNIGYVSDKFQELFGDTEFEIPKKLELQHKVLEKPMLDKEILEKWRPQESNLGELAWAIENSANLLKNSYANIFYISDKNNTLWAVDAYWDPDYGGWSVNVYSVASLVEWDAGHRVLSQVFSELGSSDSGDLEKRVRTMEEDMKKIRKIINLND